jgi:ribosomal protein L21E
VAARTRITSRRKRGKAVVLRRSTARGANRVAFSGRVGRVALRPGTHRAALVATDAAGNRSKTVYVRFRVVR